MTQSNKRMHATRDTPDVIFGWVVGGRVMRGVRLLRRFGITHCWRRGRGGWLGGLMKTAAAVRCGLTSTQAGSAGHGAGCVSPFTSRMACGGLKMARNLTTACTRPPTRRLSSSLNAWGGG